MVETNLFELLKTKEIYAILDGDTKFEDYKFADTGETTPISMPYLRGQDLCDISTRFGLSKTYTWGGNNLSRWQYLDELLTYCINNNKCSDLLSYLFGKQQFSALLSEHSVFVIEKAYDYFVTTIIAKINGILYFGGNELAMLDKNFVVRKIASNVVIQTPKLKNIDREYIKSISVRALEDIEKRNFDSAITKSRTLLEETFCYVIEKKNAQPSISGNIKGLYKQVKNLYHMHGDEGIDKRINMLLSGLEKIVTSISEMRNKDSDAHGVGVSRINIEEHHARLFVNASMIMADFILSVEINANSN